MQITDSHWKGKNMKRLSILIVAFFFFVSAGCSTPLTTREKGAGLGTLGGAALGGIIGSASGNAGAGAGIGSIIGLLGGALIGDRLQTQQDREREHKRQLEANRAELARQRAEIESLKRKREY